MKGLVFTEFLQMVEGTFGFDRVDAIIQEAQLPNGGAYTAVGTYDHQEMVALVSALSRQTGKEVPWLLQAYGTYLFGRFVKLYPAFFDKATDAFEFLENVETYIHVEVLKIYPTAELPRFASRRPAPNHLEMDYLSSRHLEDLAEGLIRGCLQHFQNEATITRSALPDGAVRFTIVRPA
jgi:Haem-NO-binding